MYDMYLVIEVKRGVKKGCFPHLGVDCHSHSRSLTPILDPRLFLRAPSNSMRDVTHEPHEGDMGEVQLDIWDQLALLVSFKVLLALAFARRYAGVTKAH